MTGSDVLRNFEDGTTFNPTGTANLTDLAAAMIALTAVVQGLLERIEKLEGGLHDVEFKFSDDNPEFKPKE